MSTRENISNLIPYHKGINHFDYDIAIDWAIDLISSGIETDNILILASFSKPTDSTEIKPHLSAVLRDLDIEEKEGDESVIALIHFILSEIRLDNSCRENLSFLYALYLEKDSHNNNDKFRLLPFYLLYYAWKELDEFRESYSYEGVTLTNIKSEIKSQAQNWIDTNIYGLEPNTKSFNRDLETKEKSPINHNLNFETKIKNWFFRNVKGRGK